MKIFKRSQTSSKINFNPEEIETKKIKTINQKFEETILKIANYLRQNEQNLNLPKKKKKKKETSIYKKKDSKNTIELESTKDILKYLGENKKDQILCGFSMETEHLINNSRVKLEKKNLNMIVANNLKTEGAGFSVDTNVVTLITNSEIKELPIMPKEMVAKEILTYIHDNFIK